MKLGYDLTIEQTQKLMMTPELIQAIQILQFNTQELEQYVAEQLLANPILEVGTPEVKDEAAKEESSADEAPRELKEETFSEKASEEFDWAEHLKERGYDDISYRHFETGGDQSEFSYEQFVTSDVTLSEHLLFQLQFISMKPIYRQASRYIVEALDPNGYLTIPVAEIAARFDMTEKQAAKALSIVQSLEPAGVGARNLKECLLIQLAAKEEDTPAARQVVMEHLEDLAGNRLSHIAKSLGISIKEAQSISDVIKSLEPKPGRQFGSFAENRYIIPDVTVEKVEGEYVVTVNENNTPRLMVSSYYQKMLAESERDSQISKFLSERLNSAMWLIKSIEQRRQTIYNVASAIVQYQKDFLDEGTKYLRTLTLKQIADEVGIHESTVSRSINGKYMQTPRGLFEIKYFFTSGVTGVSGEGVASESVKTILKELTDNEDPRAPLSDQAMVEILAQKGINISRRTVAKYRDEMGMPSSSKRKRY
ncbi:MAG: RNA polymerase factor sigma-54 [Clostridiales bacterium]|nr:RNA polymerase factor sigma-54 [Clostridiales bacterium]